MRLSRAGAVLPGRRVLLLAPPTSYRTHAYLEAARALGLEPVVVSEGRHAVTPEAAAGIRVDLSDPGAAAATVLDAVRGQPVAAVVPTDDATTVAASHVARALGLRHNAPEAVRTARRKDLARRALAEAGVPVPWHRRIRLGAAVASQLEGVPFPCVVKPLALSASRGVIRADDPPALRSACERVARIVADLPDADERSSLLVEGYLPGSEVAVEGLLDGGELRVLAVFDKPDPLTGPFFEETYYVTPSRLPARELERIHRRTAEAAAALGLREGPVHAELRVHRGEAWLLEVAARTIGGDCARALTTATGRSLESVVLGHAAGLPLEAQGGDRAAGVLMLPTPGAGTLRRVEGVLEASSVPGVEDVVIAVREGYELTPLPEGGDYLGFVFARGATPAQVEAALRRAHACLRVVLAPAWRPMVVPT